MKYGLCIEMALSKLPFEDRIRKAAELGFKYVEMWFVDRSYTGAPEHLAEVAAECGVQITNTVIAPPDASFGGGLTNPRNRPQWLERVRFTLDFNQRAGIPRAVICTGNDVKGMSQDEMRRSVIEGLKPTIELAEKAGIGLLLEPLNTPYDHPQYWLGSSDLGADIVRTLDSECLRLLFDCYHMQIMEGDLLNHIRRNMDVIGHFHSAGVPGRFELYKSEVNYPYLVAEIEKLGYQGVFGLEYQPSEDDEVSIRKTLKHLGAETN